MSTDAVAGDGRKRRGVLWTAIILGVISLALYVGTFVLRHYGKY